MKNKGKEYLKTDYSNLKVIKTEILLTPLLIITPLLVAGFFINSWFLNGFSKGVSSHDGELMLAIIILVGNIIFDIPFASSMIKYKKILSQYKKLSKKLKEIKLFNKP
jgi:hypothetical protein